MHECIHLNCSFNTSGHCLDAVLKDPNKQTGCLFYTEKNIPDYPKDENCKFCINRWDCRFKENGVCQREE